MRKLKNIFLIISVAILIIVAVIIGCISPITKYLVERYDVQYSGRQITMDWAYVNPFTGYIHLSNVHISEQGNDSIFFAALGITANFNMVKLLSKTYEISKITLDQPRGMIIQNKKQLNFSDLIERFSSKKDSDKKNTPIHFNILEIKVNDGTFYYNEQLTPVYYYIKHVYFQSSGKQWDIDTMAVKFFFISGIGNGNMKGDFSINFNNKDYHLSATATKFNLQIIEQYLKDLTNDVHFRADFDANIKAKGNFNDKENITASGLLAINNFHLGKDSTNDYTSFEKLILNINELSPKNHKYLFDSISLEHPYFKYERYDNQLDNVQTMFGKKGSKVAAVNNDPKKFNLLIEIAKYIKVLSKNFFKSNYNIKKINIYDGEFQYNDYSLNEKFSLALNSLYISADSIDKNHKWVNATIKSSINPYGNIAVDLRINPNDSSDFDLQYNLQKFPATMLNPYVIKYTSFPLDRGTIEAKGNWTVRNGIIQSNNHLTIIDPRITKQSKNDAVKWIPMPLIMFLVRERGNVIDYEIPITGDLKKPTFNLNDVLFDLVENIFVKPATTPYRIEVRNTEIEIEKFLSLKWQLRSAILINRQNKFIEKMADYLRDNPMAYITISSNRYATKEKEYILLFEAKKKYYMALYNKNEETFSEKDSEAVDKMSIKDSLFVHYLDKQIGKQIAFTIQEKCSKVIDSAFVNNKFQQLNSARKKAFMAQFRDKKIEKQIKFTHSENIVPYNGFSFYKIEYKGEFPEPLIKAYQKMNELNDEIPRKRFKEKRKANKNTI